MKTFKKALPILGVLFWALLLAPFFFGAQAAHPATDDFTFAVYTHPTWVQTGSVLHVLKDALSYALRTWRDWQGTVTGVIVMTINPTVFSLAHYGAHAVVLLALCLRTLQTGLRCPDALGCNICVGIFAALFLQCVINIGMNLQVLPVIGVTLPFFSAGGSSVVMMYLCVGIVLSVGMNTRRSKLEMQQIL